MLPVGVDNPLINMAASDLVSFGKKFIGAAKTHQMNEIQKDIDIGQRNARIANQLKAAPDRDFIPSISDVLSVNSGSITADKPQYISGNSAHSVSDSPFAPQTVDYLNADLAKHYGLGASTAYQEALSNTAYQRAVKDMKAAGLNPAAIFGAGKGYTAGGVSYVEPSSSSDRSYGGSSGFASKNKGKLFSEGAYHAISTAIGLTTMTAMNKGPIGYYIGETTAKSVMGALNEIFR